MTKNIILGAVAALVLGPAAALAADLPVKASPAGRHLQLDRLLHRCLQAADLWEQVTTSMRPTGFSDTLGLTSGEVWSAARSVTTGKFLTS